VKALSLYLLDRAKYYSEEKLGGDPVVICEVGAGDGRLCAFLKIIKDSYMRERGLDFPVEIYASDSGDWGIKSCIDGLVEKCNYDDFIRKKQPHIVFVSWMPQGQDWSQTFRDCSNLYEYVIIGDSDTGVTGHVWLTWGNSPLPPEKRPDPPWVKDNWTRHDLPDVSRFQICKLDKYGCWFNSTSSSFRKNEVIDVVDIPLTHFTTLQKLN